MCLQEENRGEPLRQRAILHALQVDRVRDLMKARADDLVGPTFEGISDVDDHLVGVFTDDGHEPGHERATAAILEFEPAHGVLKEECDDAKIAVRPSTLGKALLQLLDRDGRVVIEA